MWALSRPEELMALVKLRVAAGQIKRHIPPEKHWGFTYSMLQKVSRSFALVIQQLGPDLRNAVSNPLPSPAFLPSSPIPPHDVLNGSKGALRSYSLHRMVANVKHQSFFNTR
jgi:hypothetical protein